METTKLEVTALELTAHAAWGVSLISRGEEVYLATTPGFADEVVQGYEEPYPLEGVSVTPEDQKTVRDEITDVQMDRGAEWPTVARYLGIR